jgi:hypothetical protein
MVTITTTDHVDGVTKGTTLTVDSLHGLLAGDTDSSGYPLGVTGISTGSSSTVLWGGDRLGTRHLWHAGDAGGWQLQLFGQQQYQLAGRGVVQDHFTATITDSHGNSTQETLTITVMRPGLQYVAGQPGRD